MRIVFTGITPTVIKAAKGMVALGHELVLIEINKDNIDQVSDDLDCSFLHGDAGKPVVLSEVAPEKCDFLFCFTDNDQTNIITSLLGRTMGFKKVITCLKDEDLLPLCDELGLEYVIIPNRTMSQYIENIVQGLDTAELSTLLRGEARFFTFNASNEIGRVSELGLPEKSKVIYYYRDDNFYFANDDTCLKKGDEVVILTSSEHLACLQEKWHPKNADDED